MKTFSGLQLKKSRVSRWRALVLVLVVAAFLPLVSCTAVTGEGGGERSRTWMTPVSEADLAGHGCEDQASTLDLLERVGGGIVPLEKDRFSLIWIPAAWESNPERKLVISLHGSGGCAERMFKFWHRTSGSHDFAIVALQYAGKEGDGTLGFDDGRTIYRLLGKTLDILGRHLPMEGVPVVLHGFSKGSARIFELAALDRAPDGMHAFSAFIADSGSTFAENRGHLSSFLRNLEPDAYTGAKFWLYCGTRDHEGRTCQGMNRMSRYITAHGGTVDALYQYQGGGHGIFLTGGRRKRSAALDDLFSYINAVTP